ncbi:hypothetical protein OBBRIDRAFT_808592 [Obba rivulosa]|uniref:Uncharacterized protein n=1 Tax=Obba rivulosa TaxID=1052685 RepID=A0A8E2DEJ0_9APHY|nr:hypothetical protein OBBRIDRAFT_808592 [Obba rivulosa]
MPSTVYFTRNNTGRMPERSQTLDMKGAKNIVGQEYKASHPDATAAEFNAYWNSLSNVMCEDKHRSSGLQYTLFMYPGGNYSAYLVKWKEILLGYDGSAWGRVLVQRGKQKVSRTEQLSTDNSRVEHLAVDGNRWRDGAKKRHTELEQMATEEDRGHLMSA